MKMILLTKLNGRQIALNADMIEYVEETPDTVITLNNNDKVIVKDRMAEIIDKVVQYRQTLSGLIEDEYAKKLVKV
jgi:flagellar protein FlbD